MNRGFRAVRFLAFFAVALPAAHVDAAPPNVLNPRSATPANDGAYGRLEGDLALSLEGGIAYARRVAPAAEARLLYLATAGAYASFAGRTSDAAPWSLGAGVELRPLFLPRFLKARECGHAELDLVLDSVALRLGARRDREGYPPALELGTGIEIPMLARYDGPFFSAQLSAILGRDAQRGGRDIDGAAAYLATFTIGWRLTMLSHAVDVGDSYE